MAGDLPEPRAPNLPAPAARWNRCCSEVGHVPLRADSGRLMKNIPNIPRPHSSRPSVLTFHALALREAL
eukprot:3631415-Pyramimonas_sp.AAC.1